MDLLQLCSRTVYFISPLSTSSRAEESVQFCLIPYFPFESSASDNWSELFMFRKLKLHLLSIPILTLDSVLFLTPTYQKITGLPTPTLQSWALLCSLEFMKAARLILGMKEHNKSQPMEQAAGRDLVHCAIVHTAQTNEMTINLKDTPCRIVNWRKTRF